MPTYDYKCEHCLIDYEKIRSIAERDLPRDCPHCGEYDKSKQTICAPNLHGMKGSYNVDPNKNINWVDA